MSAKIRILVVDDHDAFRASLVNLLAREKDMEIVGQSADGKEALINVAVHSPDIILMDIKMPRLDGIEAASILSQKCLPCKVIIMTMYEEYLNEAIRCGVRGYLLKGINTNALTASIRIVNQGKIVIDERLRSKVKV